MNLQTTLIAAAHSFAKQQKETRLITATIIENLACGSETINNNNAALDRSRHRNYSLGRNSQLIEVGE